jgi:hypothetical protein
LRRYFATLSFLWVGCAALLFGIRDAWPLEPGMLTSTDLHTEEPAIVLRQVAIANDLGDIPVIEHDDACFVGSESENEYIRMREEAASDQCSFAAPARAVRSHVPYNRGFAATCEFAARLRDYERRLDGIARAELGVPLARIDQVGGYACRNVYGGPVGRPSEHAHANAIDISGFVLEDGSIVTVAGDWGDDTPEGLFLKRVRDEACRSFKAVLSPEYNAAHADHFHLDLGRYDMCH